jgi:hypothetical protein
MAGQLRLSETQLSDFRSLVELPEAQLSSILRQLNELTPVPMSQEEVRRVISRVLPDEQAKVEALTRQVFGLAGLQYRSDIPHNELNEALRSSMEEKLDSSEMEAWDQISPLFNQILASRAIHTTVKSLELLYDYANLATSSNVITDVRPVFDDEADHVIGAIVSFTLRLSYQNGNSANSLSLAMDAEDVRKLQEQCKRALKKAETARTQFSGSNASETRVEISGKFER